MENFVSFPSMFRFCHASDAHLPTPVRIGGHLLSGKRLLAYLSWRFRRRRRHTADGAHRFLELLGRERPPLLLLTGDNVNTGMAAEFEEAARWFRQIEAGETKVRLVAGNHDALTADALRLLRAHWAEWHLDGASASATDGAGKGEAPVSFFGLRSGTPTKPFLAGGRIPEKQLEALDGWLEREGRAGRFRVVALHHPPGSGACGRRKALWNAATLRSLLARRGCELVLHGHMQAPWRGEIAGPEGAIPVRGAGSLSLSPCRRPPGHCQFVGVGEARGLWLLRIEHFHCCGQNPFRLLETEVLRLRRSAAAAPSL